MANQRLSETLLATVRTARNQDEFEVALQRIGRVIDRYVPNGSDPDEPGLPQVNRSRQLPVGQSEPAKWPGGMALVRIRGVFPSGGGVSTAVELCCRERQADGSLKRPVVLRVFREPGEYSMAIPPGEYSFHASGPEKLPWEVWVKVEEPPRPPRKGITLEERIEVLEARLGNAGLNS